MSASKGASIAAVVGRRLLQCRLCALLLLMACVQHMHAWKHHPLKPIISWKKCLAPILTGLSLWSAAPISSVHAAGTREIANVATSGIVFKDTLRISAFQDPKVSGVVLYLSDFDRPLTEKLAKDFFNDPSTASLACAKTGDVTFSKDINLSSEGEEIFEESRNLFFKQIRVRRIIDKQTKTIVYVAYNTRFNKNDDSNKARFRSSMCAIHAE